MTGFAGADIDEVRALAARFEQQADRLHQIVANSTAAIMIAAWTGANVDRLRADWKRDSQPRIRALAQQLSHLATDLRRQATEQSEASAARSGAPTPQAESDPTRGAPAPGDIRGLLEDMKDLNDGNDLLRVQHILGDDGKLRLVVTLPGTKNEDYYGLGGWNDTIAQYLLGDSAVLRSVYAELRRELAKYPNAEVMLVGYSQGGLLAQVLATVDEFNVKEVVTIASPRLDLNYGEANVTRFEHNADPVVNGTEYLRGSIFSDWGRDFKMWAHGETTQNEVVNFRQGNFFEDKVHDLGSGDYDWLADQWQNSSDPAHSAARDRQALFLNGTVLDTKRVQGW